ncbi:MAG: LysR substrate-binding domain-containing protein [Pseudomonadota bacterium]
MDRFEDLKAFVQVVESGSLTRAADVLQVATSAVSRRIKDLEGRLGTQLLQRTTRQMRLTASGETFHRRAVEILQALDEAEAEAGDQSRALSGTLRIAAPLSFGHSHLAPILIDFATEHPDLELDVDLSDRMVDLIGEGLDLAVRIGNLRDSSLIARRLAEVRTVICASPGFIKAQGRPEQPEDLEKLPFLFYTGSDRGESLPFVRADGSDGTISLQPVLRSNNGDLLRDAAVAGLGFALEPSFIIHRAVEEGSLVPLLTDVTWPSVTIHIIYPQTRHLSARARAFIDYARARIGTRPDWEGFLDA